MPGVEIIGIAELRQAMRDASDAMPREVSKALRTASVVLKNRMDQLAPKRSGKLVANNRPFSNDRSSGVRNRLPYAGVQEFAEDYKRKNRSGQGTHIVHLRGNVSPPRFGYRALGELREELPMVVDQALRELLTAKGWLG